MYFYCFSNNSAVINCFSKPKLKKRAPILIPSHYKDSLIDTFHFNACFLIYLNTLTLELELMNKMSEINPLNVINLLKVHFKPGCKTTPTRAEKRLAEEIKSNAVLDLSFYSLNLTMLVLLHNK